MNDLIEEANEALKDGRVEDAIIYETITTYSIPPVKEAKLTFNIVSRFAEDKTITDKQSKDIAHKQIMRQFEGLLFKYLSQQIKDKDRYEINDTKFKTFTSAEVTEPIIILPPNKFFNFMYYVDYPPCNMNKNDTCKFSDYHYHDMPGPNGREIKIYNCKLTTGLPCEGEKGDMDNCPHWRKQ